MLAGLFLAYINLAVQKEDYSRTITRTPAENFIGALSFWGIWVLAVTEILSIGNWISRISLVVSWSLFIAIQAFFLIRYAVKNKESFRTVFCTGWKTICARGPFDKIIFISFAFYGLVLVCFALSVVPYNCDSMVYHLARIINWAHNGSVAHYATDNWRSISSTPFAEFIGLHIYVLSDGADSFINLIQTASYLSIIYMVYRLAQRIGCDKKGARFAAAVYATIPIAFAESNTTQNDEFAALWLVCIVYMLVGIVKEPQRLEWKSGNGAGIQLVQLCICVGLGYLTKPSIIPAMAVFIVWMLFRLVKDKKVTFVRIGQWIGGSALGAVVVIAPEVGRNIITYHAVSYSGVGQRQIVGTIKPNYLLINFLKNYFYNSPSIYWPNIYWRFEKLIYSLADILHVDVNDWAIAETGVEYELPYVNYGCDTAVNFVMFALVSVCMILYLCRKFCEKSTCGKMRNFSTESTEEGRKGFFVKGYCFAAFFSYLLMMLIMRWQPYVNRHMIGYFALLAPAIALEFDRSSHVFAYASQAKNFRNALKEGSVTEEHSDIFGETAKTTIRLKASYIRGLMTGMVLILSAVEFSIMFDELRLDVEEKSSQSRIQQYFTAGQDKIDDYTTAVELVINGGYRLVGLKLEGASFEYPLIRMLEESIDDFAYVNVESDTSYLENTAFIPECIIYTGEATQELLSGHYTCHGVVYEKITKLSDVCWFIEQ